MELGVLQPMEILYSVALVFIPDSLRVRPPSMTVTLAACCNRICVFLVEAETPLQRHLDDAETPEAIRLIGISRIAAMCYTRWGSQVSETWYWAPFGLPSITYK